MIESALIHNNNSEYYELIYNGPRTLILIKSIIETPVKLVVNIAASKKKGFKQNKTYNISGNKRFSMSFNR